MGSRLEKGILFWSGPEYRIWGVVIRARRARDGPAATNAFVVEGNTNFGIVGEAFGSGCGDMSFEFLRGWRESDLRTRISEEELQETRSCGVPWEGKENQTDTSPLKSKRKHGRQREVPEQQIRV